MNAEDSLQRAEVLLERLERTRQELESTQDPDRAIEILSEQVVRTMKLLGAHSLEELTPRHVTQLERLVPRARA